MTLYKIVSRQVVAGGLPWGREPEMTFLTKEYHFGLSRFRDLSLNTIIALE